MRIPALGRQGKEKQAQEFKINCHYQHIHPFNKRD